MGIERLTNIGWIPVIKSDLDAYECTSILAEKDPDWEDFICDTGQDDDFGNICVFNSKYDSWHYNTEDGGFVPFNAVPKSLSERAQEFIELFEEEFGYGSIKVSYGMVTWYA